MKNTLQRRTFCRCILQFCLKVGINKPDTPSWDSVFALDEISIKNFPKGKPILAVNPIW